MPSQTFLTSLASQNEISMRDLPSRIVSVTLTYFAGLCFADVWPMTLIFAGYLAVEFLGARSARSMIRRFTPLAYGLHFLACILGTVPVLAMLALAAQHPSSAAAFYSKVLFFGTILHVIVVHSYHLPFTFAVFAPVVLTGAALTHSALQDEPDLIMRGVGYCVAAVLCFYAFQAIFQLNRMRQSTVRARDRAEAANRSKSRFVTAMSHEIRTPLNGILGIAQLEIEDADTDQRRDRAGILLSSATTLRALVDDVLDHAKIEAGKIEIRPTAIDPAHLADTVVRLFGDLARRKGIVLAVDGSADLPPMVMADALRLRQILSNLVSNAIKFTEQGEVRLTLGATRGGPRPEFWITIRDTGAGMTMRDQARLFHSFSQVDGNQERAATGTGLGLAISRSLARMMDGDITVRSTPGSGSIFRFQMPLVLPGTQDAALSGGGPSPAHANALAALSLTAQRILLVDDNRANRMIARAFMEKAQMQVTEADGGAAALALIRQETFDLVLLDMHMPEMDGLETLGHIRRASLLSGHLPVIALTADAAPEDRAHYMAQGLDGYLSKPLGKDDMFQEIDRVLRRGAARPMAAE